MNISSWEFCRRTCFGATVVEPFARHSVGFILVGTVFVKAFRIFGLDERKGRWILEHDGLFHCRLCNLVERLRLHLKILQVTLFFLIMANNYHFIKLIA